MRIALLPIIGFKNIQGESDYILYRKMAEDFSRMDRPVFSYMCLPSHAFDKARNEPGILNLYTEGPNDSNDQGGFHDMLATSSLTFLDLFAPRNAKYPIDAVITSLTDAVPNLARWLWDWRAGKEFVPTIIFEPQICNIPINDRNETWLLNRTLGYLMGWPVFNTEHEKSLALEAANRFFQASLVKKLEERSSVIPCTVAFDDLDAAMKKNKRSEKFTLFYGGRLNAAKRADKMLDIYDEFYSSGRDVDIVVCSPKGEKRIVVPSSVTLHRGLPRAEFLVHAARAHVYLNTSVNEGFSVGFVEQVYIVPVSIVPDLPWVRSILDEGFDDHPFVYKNFREARVLLRYVYDHYDEAVARCQPIRDYLAVRYDNTVLVNQIISVVDDVVERCRQNSVPGAVQEDLLYRAFNALGDRFTFDTFWRRFKSNQISEGDVPKLGDLWKWQAYVWLGEHASDLCTGPTPEYEKR